MIAFPGPWELLPRVMGVAPPAREPLDLTIIFGFVATIITLGVVLLFLARLSRRNASRASQTAERSAESIAPLLNLPPIDAPSAQAPAEAQPPAQPPAAAVEPGPATSPPASSAEPAKRRETRSGLLTTAASLLEAGNFGAAAACFREAGDLRQAAQCYHRAGDQEKVIECLEAAGDHYRLGRVLARQGERDRAIECFERVESDHPKYAKSLLILARLAYVSGQTDRSVELIRTFLPATTNVALRREGRKLLAKLLELQMRYGEALEVLEQLQTELPSDETVSRRLLRVRERMEIQLRAVDAPLESEPEFSSVGHLTGVSEHDVLDENEHPTDRYQLFERIGEGSIGRVYKGYDHELEERVAVKFLNVPGHRSSLTTRAFREAAQAAAELNHPNIVRIRQVGELEGHAFLAMDYVAGRTLAQRLSDGEAAPTRLVLNVALQLAQALDHIHDRDIAHGELDPRNVLLRDDPTDEVILTDIGIATAVRSADPTAVAAARDSAYRAPEAAADPRADIFAFGVILYRMLTGALPFLSRPTLSQAPATPPWVVMPSVPMELGQIVLQCLEPRPELRPARAGEVAAVVRQRLIERV